MKQIQEDKIISEFLKSLGEIAGSQARPLSRPLSGLWEKSQDRKP
jgi:hypothetical protein